MRRTVGAGMLALAAIACSVAPGTMSSQSPSPSSPPPTAAGTAYTAPSYASYSPTPTSTHASSPDITAPANPDAVGKIAFASSRDGLPGIFLMDADGSNVSRLTDDGGWGLAWSPGSRIAFNRSDGEQLQILTVDLEGSVERVTEGVSPAWSPDGTRIAFASARDGDFEIYVADADGLNLVQLTNNNGADDHAPSWSPDGARIVFESYKRPAGESNDDASYAPLPEIFVIDIDGANRVQLTDSQDDDWTTLPRWSPDGSRIAFLSDRSGQPEIHLMEPDGTYVTRLTYLAAQELGAASWSPNGHHIAFAGRAGGGLEIYVMDADGDNVVQLTHDAPNPHIDDTSPVWAP